ncbi:MAG TPA: complex I NDUFA9 subunit family protein [Gaiellaceae bacterium]
MILVTGGTGFVGPKVVHALRAEDRPVRCLVRNPERAGQLTAWGCELVEGDVTDPDSLQRAVAGCDTVVHLVAIIAGKPEDFERIMSQGTRDLVAAAKAAGVRRFVLMSALGTNEQTKELVPYFRSKWEMEETVKASGLEHVIFRPSFVFGRDGGVLPTFTRLIRYLPATPVIGPGTQRIQPIWVEDVAAYFAKAVGLPAAPNRTFEIGGPDVVTWNELYDRISAVLGKRRVKIHLPFGLMRVNAAVLEALPGPTPVTRDQLAMIEAGDNVVSNDDAVRTFGLPLLSLNEQLRRAV